MSENALYLNVGGGVVVPKSGEKAIFVDSDGTLKTIDSTGTEASVGGGSVTEDRATASGNVVNLDVSGLSGDTDGDYEFDGLINVPADGVNLATFTIQPNGLSTNQASSTNNVFSGGAGFSDQASLFIAGSQDGAGGTIRFHGRLWSKTETGRLYICHARRRTSTPVSYVTEGDWNALTAITSLRLASNYNGGAAGILTGSFIRVRRLRNGV